MAKLQSKVERGNIKLRQRVKELTEENGEPEAPRGGGKEKDVLHRRCEELMEENCRLRGLSPGVDWASQLGWVDASKFWGGSNELGSRDSAQGGRSGRSAGSVTLRNDRLKDATVSAAGQATSESHRQERCPTQTQGARQRSP